MDQPLLMSDVNVMLLGLTGVGKSASGNSILGRDRTTFEEDFSPESVTRICQSAQTEVNGQKITVFDTVGLPETSVKSIDVQTEIGQALQSTCDGFDVFLLVIKLGDKFREFERNAVQWSQDNFGVKVLLHTIVLFTHGDQLQVPLEDYLSKCEALRSVVDQCSGGYHVFNNKDKDRTQVTELLNKMNTLRRKNRYKRYTEQDYKETQDEILLRKLTIGAAEGAAAGVLGGAAVGAVAAKAGAVALNVGKAAAIGASGGAVIAAAVGVGVYVLARKHSSREKDKSD